MVPNRGGGHAEPAPDLRGTRRVPPPDEFQDPLTGCDCYHIHIVLQIYVNICFHNSVDIQLCGAIIGWVWGGITPKEKRFELIF